MKQNDGTDATHSVARPFPVLKTFLVFILLLVVTFITNAPVISFDLMYPEQPTIYAANQTIQHVSDLLNIYLHPQLLNRNIPFFRPSGHFLIYQLLAPLLGWHNTKGFIIVNFIFLTLTGVLLIEIYQSLFPRYKAGGYIAYSLLLMHPALNLSRITLMHFEFAYVFFLILSLYVFMIFCRKNKLSLSSKQNAGNIQDIRFRHYYLLAVSLLIYAVAVTFKEPAIMLGPVLACYFLICLSRRQTNRQYIFGILHNRQVMFILFLMTAASLLLGLYLIASWPGLKYPSTRLSFDHTVGTINSFLRDIWGYNKDLFSRSHASSRDWEWRIIAYPYAAKLMLWTLSGISLLSITFIWLSNSRDRVSHLKSLLFLFVSAILFLILPFIWATGGPWHYSLTLICVNLILGFGLEYFCELAGMRRFPTYALCLFLSLINMALAVNVNQVNIDRYNHVPLAKIGISVNRNAIQSPPDIKNKLTPNSVIVVEDSRIHVDYLMGNAAYPFFLFLQIGEYDTIEKIQSQFYQKFHPTYSGNLFRYAYLMPGLKEELYPFNVDNMDELANEVIYNWLTHFNDIFCLGYDSSGNWHDKTARFKAQLLQIKAKRELDVHLYTSRFISVKNTNTYYTEDLSIPDPNLCQYKCDQDNSCKGFAYEYSRENTPSLIRCHYSSQPFSSGNEACKHCAWFAKSKAMTFNTAMEMKSSVSITHLKHPQ